jgi:prepilin-type N-terminal cleavage/methylation domain-containing protein
MVSRLKNESGYSLVEVLAAIVILAVAILPMVGMFDAGLRAAVLGSNYDQARALANEELEEVRALGYEEANNAYPPADSPNSCTDPVGDTFDCEVTTEYQTLEGGAIVDGSGAMMKVTVEVTWDNNSYETTGLVADGSP